MITTAIQTRNFRMMLTRTSRSSKATSWCTGKPPGPLLRCSVLMLRNGLRKFRIAQGQQRLLLQVHGEETNPQADKGDGYDNVQPGGQRAGSKFRAGIPEEVDEPHDNHPQSDLGDQVRRLFYVAGKQHEERQREAEQQTQYGDNSKLAVEARTVERNFFGLVAGPDD